MEGLNGRLERHDLYNKTENVPVSPQGGTGIFCARIENRFHRAEKESALEGHGGDGTAADGQVWSPLFYGGERKEEQLLSKRGPGENVFAGGEKME